MSSALPAPLVDGRFQLLEVIGEGGMATVYRAFDTRLRRTLAIKVLSPALAGRPSLRNRFLGEARAMVRLTDVRIVRVLDSGEEGDRAYIIMELVDGGSLLDRVRDFGPLPPRMAAKVALDLCEALQHAHEQGVIHRDIKPHNILLTRAGQLRITDFGIAQVQDDEGGQLTRTGAVMGTWGFMAPEQKSDARKVDHRADVYSVGATLWSILRGETPPELFMADQEPQMLDGIPEELVAIIRRATRYRREDRYPTMREMANSVSALLPLIEPDPDDALPLCPPRPPRPEVARPADPPPTAGGVPNLAASLATAAAPSMPGIPAGASSPPRPSDPPSEPRATPGVARPETIVPTSTQYGAASPLPPPRSPPTGPSPGGAGPSLGSAGPSVAATGPSVGAPSLAGPSPGGSTGPTPGGTASSPTREAPGVGGPPAGESPWMRWGLTLGFAAVAAVAIAVAYTFLTSTPAAEGPPADAIPTEAIVPTPELGALPEAAPGAPGAGAATAGSAPAAGASTAPGSASSATSSPAGSATPSDRTSSARQATPATPPAAEPAAEAAVASTSAPPEGTVGAVRDAAPADTSRPFLTVSPPASARVGQEVRFEAQALPGWTVHLYYRAAGTSTFKDRTLAGEDGRYSGLVAVDEAMAGGIEYFVEATNGVGGKVFEGRYSSPRTVAVAP